MSDGESRDSEVEVVTESVTVSDPAQDLGEWARTGSFASRRNRRGDDMAERERERETKRN